ncbi:MAG: hypothetical protein PUI48_07015 [Oscillospiraceae bacterium]|nr:hypothetical protein [Oscillospiraceae bacterium]MDY6207960.1 hypothetical protein [Oscillospiraceae bacterium]
MPDFSDKYKKALEYQEISPDFKEWTARLMTELRDSEELIPETDEENLPVEKPVSVSENELMTSRRIKLIKVISTAAAAAACLTVGVALNNAGIFDKDSDPSVIATDSMVTEATDIIEADITAEERVSEAELSTTAAAVSEYEDTTAFEAIHETAPQSMTETVTEASAVTETSQDIKPSAASFSAEPASAPVEEPAAEEYDEIIEESPVEAAPAEGAGIAPSAYDSGEKDNDLPLETVLILEPFSEEAEMEEEADIEEDEEIVEEVPTDITSAADMSRAASFSPKEAVSEFSAQNSTAVITPAFEDINSEDGSVVTYEPKEVRSVTKLLNLNKEISAYAEEGEASIAAEAPSDSRYIIDYAGKQGNAMRIYMGSRYICFAYGGYYYTFELTEEEYNELDGVLFGLIS